MTCPRCRAEVATPRGWCAPCELVFDAWNRRNASDIITSVLGGTVVLLGVGIGLPLLGLGWVVATAAAFAGFGMIYGTHRMLGRRRRRQFLAGAIPRAHLVAPRGSAPPS
jgi:hypothetical protein